MEKIYVLSFKWSVEGDHGLELYAFKEKENARIKMNQIIKAEKSEGMSWVETCSSKDSIETQTEDSWYFAKSDNINEWYDYVKISEIQVK